MLKKGSIATAVAAAVTAMPVSATYYVGQLGVCGGGTCYENSPIGGFGVLPVAGTTWAAFAQTTPLFGGAAIANIATSGTPVRAEALLVIGFVVPDRFRGTLETRLFGHSSVFGSAEAEFAYILFRKNSAQIIEAYSFSIDSYYSPPDYVSFGRRTRFRVEGGEIIETYLYARAESLGVTPGMAWATMDPIFTLSAAVPEPGTWAMLIAGFGVVGMAARRRRALA